ncbi:MAG: AAA family ATPase [Actinobacteria bacterium]|nr:AAA family ATPase [Actinomycetota bacterium]
MLDVTAPLYCPNVRLVAFSLEGYRRFVAKTSVKLHGDLVAFVGPNEAGKSSLLWALAHLHKTGAFDPNERPRRTNLEPKLTWHFQLEAADREALESVPDTGHVERAVVTKKADGTKTWHFEPRRPRRNRGNREAAAQLLKPQRDNRALREADADEDSEFRLEDFDRALETLEADVENFEAGHLDGLRDMTRHIRDVEYGGPREDPDEGTQEGEPVDHAALRDEWESHRDAMARALEEVVAEEATPSPWRLAVDALQGRLPRILLLSDEDRALASQYDLTEIGDPAPGALGHLASLADLDLIALRNEATAEAVPDVATRRNAANRNLLAAFDQAWNQQGIAVQIEVQGTILHIQATTPEDAGLSDIGERSDGMRWFAALLAYAHGWHDQPILLVDEIERHLHYDAQSDLVEVLAKQEFTSKVTTRRTRSAAFRTISEPAFVSSSRSMQQPPD